ncbi:hypothetical protein [Dichotomicrobium thermohalophilum]|uniref:Uncharacterized protein n=1 Tax=Dichotomicrobium thermohalophilum TaxID=933063 RepID=A0A397QDB0_9HYPH|nr:hypothetical protein [Dichotomicrobium thermohalophilum]RIA56074.1 hypothetical protein BXY53_1170 [Dichotomicrobium thermohalophilum]
MTVRLAFFCLGLMAIVAAILFAVPGVSSLGQALLSERAHVASAHAMHQRASEADELAIFASSHEHHHAALPAGSATSPQGDERCPPCYDGSQLAVKTSTLTREREKPAKKSLSATLLPSITGPSRPLLSDRQAVPRFSLPPAQADIILRTGRMRI